MQTLPTYLRKLLSEREQDVRDAMRKLRDQKEATIPTLKGEDKIVIIPLNKSQRAK